MSNGHIDEVKLSHEIDILQLKSELSEVYCIVEGLQIPENLDSAKAGTFIKELHDRVMRDLLENEELIGNLRSE
jgi:hypothetical protein